MQQAAVKHMPWTFYLRILLYMFIALTLRVFALSPLLALCLPAGSPWRYLALLCPVLVVFLVLPLRFSFAEALVPKGRWRYFSYDTALNLSNYGEKLVESVLHALNVLKWGIPFFALCGWGWYCKDHVDAKTIMNALSSLGKTATGVWHPVANFFTTLFGGAATPYIEGSLMQGVYVALGVLGLTLLLLLFGAVRNSCNRYIWVLANRGDRSARTELRRRMRGRRLRQLLVALGNLVLLAPFLVVVYLTLRDTFSAALTQLMLVIGYSPTGMPDFSGLILPLVLAFFLLYMPLLPARRILTAAFATHTPRHTAPVHETPAQPAKAADEAPAMPQAIVPDWVRAENEPAQPQNGGAAVDQ